MTLRLGQITFKEDAHHGVSSEISFTDLIFGWAAIGCSEDLLVWAGSED